MRASYAPQLNALELSCLDGEGLPAKYAPLFALAPAAYSDLYARFAGRSCFVVEADAEMIYNDVGAPEFFLFLRGSRWDARTARRLELDVRRRFSEAD